MVLVLLFVVGIVGQLSLQPAFGDKVETVDSTARTGVRSIRSTLLGSFCLGLGEKESSMVTQRNSTASFCVGLKKALES